MRTYILLLLVVCLLVPVVTYADDAAWDTRALLAQEDRDGNAALTGLIAPIGTEASGDGLTVTLIDAVYDGFVLTCAFTVTNTGGAPILLLTDVHFGDAVVGLQSYPGDERVILPGEALPAGICAEVSGVGLWEAGEAPAPLEAIDATLHLTGYPLAEGVAYGENGALEDADLLSRMGMSRVEAIEASGLFGQAHTLVVPLRVPNRAAIVSLLPDGVPVEQDNGAYTLRIRRADLSPDAVILDIDRVFASSRDVAAFQVTLSDRVRYGYVLRDEDGYGDWFRSAGQSADEGPRENVDGTWVWSFRLYATHLAAIPAGLTVVPTRRQGIEPMSAPAPLDAEAVTLAVPGTLAFMR